MTYGKDFKNAHEKRDVSPADFDLSLTSTVV